jgi:hypothetical protein
VEVGAVSMVIDRFADCTWSGTPESVTVTVKFEMPPGPVGVPVIAPVDGLRVSLPGSVPAVIF